MKPAHVLRNCATPRNRKSQEQCVQPRIIESLANEPPCRQNDATAGRGWRRRLACAARRRPERNGNAVLWLKGGTCQRRASCRSVERVACATQSLRCLRRRFRQPVERVFQVFPPHAALQ